MLGKRKMGSSLLTTLQGSNEAGGGGGGGLDTILENLEYYGDASNAESCDGSTKWMNCLVTPQSGTAQSNYNGTNASTVLNGTAGDAGTSIDFVNGTNNAKITLDSGLTTYMANLCDTAACGDWTAFAFFRWQSSTGHPFSSGGNSSSTERGVSLVQYSSSTNLLQLRAQGTASTLVNLTTSDISLSDGEDIMVVFGFDDTANEYYLECKGVRQTTASAIGGTGQLVPTFGIRADNFGDMTANNYLYSFALEATLCDSDTIASVKSLMETTHDRTYDGGL